eukprot:CAMPEP_0184095962 /NCGR_PEP_ID=MMETSP0974-20121125/10039_1 /TAXON_ID=483370 /ORGANISM="non described non described, Strain CCMP2097" /LENGTH=388 /DNA_ID=CAMNT_0026398779 /DNA_START=11 /DNA_END=1175 /DNA_ORIENTATION=+
MKWTVPALALQIQATARKARRAGTALGRDAFPRRVLDVLLNIDDIRVALEAWGIVSPAPAPLADDDALVEALAALARGLVETGPVKKVSRGERRPSTALTERGEPLGADMTVRDVVAFAHAVSEAGGEAFVSVHLVDAALRAARRASAAAEDLERGAVDVESLRENLAEARGVGLDAWLAACATTRPENACLSAADLREGLLGELGGDGDAAAAAATHLEALGGGGGDLSVGVGTRAYAAPEQLSSDDYGQQADIFSLGLVLFEMVHPKFATAMERAVVFADLHARKLPDTKAWPQRDDDVAELINSMLAPTPTERPSAAEALTVVERMLDRSVVRALRHSNSGGTVILRGADGEVRVYDAKSGDFIKNEEADPPKTTGAAQSSISPL